MIIIVKIDNLFLKNNTFIQYLFIDFVYVYENISSVSYLSLYKISLIFPDEHQTTGERGLIDATEGG